MENIVIKKSYVERIEHYYIQIKEFFIDVDVRLVNNNFSELTISKSYGKEKLSLSCNELVALTKLLQNIVKKYSLKVREDESEE